MDEIIDDEGIAFEGVIPRIIKASLLVRIKSSIIDTVTVVLLMYIASMVLDEIGVESGMVRGLVLLSVILYEPIMVSLNRTLGQKIMGLRVRNFSKLKKRDLKSNINILSSLIRFVTKVLLGWVSLLTIQSNSYGRAIHDKFGHSVMTLENE